MKFNILLIGIIMGLMVSYGGELVRYNPANGHIEYSSSQGRAWLMRNSGSSLGKVKCIIVYGNELILCSDKGIFYSSSAGRAWLLRCPSYKNFIDLQDCGKELIASTDDGHIYYSTSAGRAWLRRR